MPAPTYQNCDGKYLNQAQKAYNEVRLLVGKANSAIINLQKYPLQATYEPKDRLEVERFAKWFGLAEQQSFNTVRNQVIYPMVRQLESHSVTIECGGDECQQDDFAYVTQAGQGLGNGIIIHLCAVFFTAPLYGTNSQVGTLLHEISHLVSNTDDIQYGQEACLRLATQHPADAMNNADNYQYYLESFHYS